MTFSQASSDKLKTCDPQLVLLMSETMRVTPIDFTILEGHRSVERQQRLFRQGASKLDGINRKSKHNASPSLAVDIAPYPIDWQDLTRFYFLAGAVLSVARFHDIPIRWGGDWDGDSSWNDQTFHDLPHFELLEVSND